MLVRRRIRDYWHARRARGNVREDVRRNGFTKFRLETYPWRENDQCYIEVRRSSQGRVIATYRADRPGNKITLVSVVRVPKRRGHW